MQVLLRGAGSLSCGKYLEMGKNQLGYIQVEEWVAGYVSGHNYYLPARQVAPPDNASLKAFIDRYCRQNPLHSLFGAAAALVAELSGEKPLHDYRP